MKKFDNFVNYDIAITLPKNIEWSEYEKELNSVADGSQYLNFKVPNLPKYTKVGNKCYLVYRDYIVGWMEITGLVKNDFICSTTGKHWDGNFIQRSGKFNRIEPIPMKGFRGFKYMK
jgi:hypothetical protein